MQQNENNVSTVTELSVGGTDTRNNWKENQSKVVKDMVGEEGVDHLPPALLRNDRQTLCVFMVYDLMFSRMCVP